MAYNPPTFRSKVVTNNFSGQRTDGNRIAMSYGNMMSTRDNTGTPQNSPLTVNTTATLVCPVNAIQVTICSVTNAVQVSEDSTMTSFFTLPAGTPFTFDCADMTNVYLKTGSSTVVSFLFNDV